MKIQMNLKAEKEASFPKLMETTLTMGGYIIVLFSDYGVGTVVYLSKESFTYNIGQVKSTWNMPKFKDFSGTITLEND